MKGWLGNEDYLLGEEAQQIFEVCQDAKDCPVVGPKGESLLIGVGLEGSVGLPEGDEKYDCVVDEGCQEFLHFFSLFESFSDKYL